MAHFENRSEEQHTKCAALCGAAGLCAALDPGLDFTLEPTAGLLTELYPLWEFSDLFKAPALHAR
jgi:hypothetical protein